MTRIEMGTIVDGYEASMMIEGFDTSYEIVEVESEVKNTYDNLQEFAEAVLLITNLMGYARLRHIASDLLAGLMTDDKEEAIKYCKETIGMSDTEMEFLL